MVDSHTVVFGIHLYIRTRQEALRSLPALLCEQGWKAGREMTSFKPELKTLLTPIAEMHDKYDYYAFPDLGHIFSSTALYWKKQSDSTSATGVPP